MFHNAVYAVQKDVDLPPMYYWIPHSFNSRFVWDWTTYYGIIWEETLGLSRCCSWIITTKHPYSLHAMVRCHGIAVPKRFQGYKRPCPALHEVIMDAAGSGWLQGILLQCTLLWYVSEILWVIIFSICLLVRNLLLILAFTLAFGSDFCIALKPCLLALPWGL